MGTAFAHRYRFDLFARTELAIVLLQFLYAATIFGLAVWALFLLYHELIGGVGVAIATALTATTTTPFTPGSILAPLEAARTREIVTLGAFIFAATVIFGYLVARITVAPARGALLAQKQFIGNIAHELRTPLAIIKTNTELRLFEADLGKEAREMHLSNLEELDRISDIINNLLSLNTLVQPERIRFSAVNLPEVAQRVIQKLRQFAAGKRIALTLAAAKTCRIHGNEAALEQIAMNLVRNAIQHTKGGGIVEITVRPSSAETVELVVRDTGTGIHRKDLARIFDPFFRGDRARARGGGAGSGLGLTIVSELVRMHRGMLKVKSALGKGTTVTVLLPAHARAPRLPDAFAAAESPDEVAIDFSRGGARA